MKKVIIESPYRGNVSKNVAYAKAAMIDSLNRWEAPFASHLMYTQFGILNDDNPPERDRGILAGLEWAKKADLVAVYEDLGITYGMNTGIMKARLNNCPIEFRKIEGWEEKWNKEQEFLEKKLKESIAKNDGRSAAFYLYPKIINNKTGEALKIIHISYLDFATMIIKNISE